MRFVSRHEETQVYGAILPNGMTNQAMIDSVAYKTYYAIASGAEPLKLKKSQKKSESAISSKESPSKKKPASKPKPTKKKAPVKADRGKGLSVLLKVAIPKAAQLKEATKRSKKYFHISHASASGDETDFESGVPDEQQCKTSSTDEGTCTKPGVLDIPKYDSEIIIDITDLNQSRTEEHEEEEDVNDEEKTMKSTRSCIKIQTSSLYTVPITIPLPSSFFNPFQQHATPTPTPTTSKTTTSFPTLPDFSPVFKLNDRVTSLEKDLSEIKQVNQHAQAISFISAIVDRYIDNKLGEAIHKAIQSHNANCREEAQAEKQEYIDLIDMSMRAIIREELKT
nr:hypothetical protein [Tanacetum cinerariifolium]